MRTLLSAFRFQFATSRNDVTVYLVLLTVPLFTVVFLLVFREAGRGDLTPFAIIAPVLIALWWMALYVAGELVDRDRWEGLLEIEVAAPAHLGTLFVGRIAAVTAVSLVSFFESIAVAWLMGETITIHHPGVFVLALVATAFATAGTALIMSCLFVLARSARTFQNSLSYPVYVLGGVLVPVTLLPGWLELLSRGVFLSWGSDLVRASLVSEPVEGLAVRLAIIVALGLVGFAIGKWLLRVVLRRVREDGSLGFA
jgi:ABC-2 type transport system permease protein